MAEKANIAVVGTGWWATTAHLPALVAHPRVGKIVLVDINAEAGRMLGPLFQSHRQQRYSLIDVVVELPRDPGTLLFMSLN